MYFTVNDMMFEARQELTVYGKINYGCKNFFIEIGHDGENIALLFNPRFDHLSDINTIVCNSKRGVWGEEVRGCSFPFSQGESFKVQFSFNKEQFYIKLPNGTIMSFPNRFGDDSFKNIYVEGDVKIQGMKVE